MRLVRISDTEYINFDHVQRVNFDTYTGNHYACIVDFDDSQTSQRYNGVEADRIMAYCANNLSFDCTLGETESSIADLIARDARENELEMWRGPRPGG